MYLLQQSWAFLCKDYGISYANLMRRGHAADNDDSNFISKFVYLLFLYDNFVYIYIYMAYACVFI